MNTKQLLLSFLLSLTMLTTYAQTSASQAGIAVQGIARDNNNTAITTGEEIAITWTIYYKDGTDKVLDSNKESVTPDAFGVFSFVMDVDPAKNSDFANHVMWLKLETQQGNTTVLISDEKLKHVPYAISANNGVPMGSIMPYLGDGTPPPGWIFLEGQTFASVGEKGSSLRAFLGNPSSVPDLRGMFLRGAGTNSIAKYKDNSGPALGKNQDDGFENHLHGKGTIAASGGTHKHKYKDQWRKKMGDDDGDDQDLLDNDFRHQDQERTTPNFDGSHSHTITGSTGNTGTILETRPVNFGISYIIKL
ncbi:MAG: hypothetical protein ACJA2M_000402 [Polaribacter sp.]|jgi:hypothetical protein